MIGTGKPIVDFQLKLAKRHSYVTVKDGTVFVEYPGTPLKFTFVASRDPLKNFYPAGITFVREIDGGNANEDRLGLRNFPHHRIRIDDHSIYITDNYLRGKNVNAYKFSLIVQRDSDGAIGIIDPGMVHDNSDARPH
ncbi:MAG: hypothetical protein ABI273_16855 [Lacunisphaera sp.]